MSGNALLVDTNVALYLLGGDETVAGILNGKDVHMSFITELELLGYPSISDGEEKGIHEFLDDCVIFDINSEVKRLAVTIRRNHRLRLPDAIIAATALYLKAPLLSADRDFEKINELSLFLYETGAP